MIKIVSIIGTRPQFIKLYPICRAVDRHNKNLKESVRKFKHIIINTGQHFDYEMSQVFINELKINTPDYNLGVREKSQCLQISKMLSSLEEILLKEKPDFILVYGDTSSTLAGALAAKKLNFKLAHIEAGLRSYNRSMPEEINRILTDKISDLLFCPTKTAMKNLENEGFLLKENHYAVFDVGDLMYDAYLVFQESAQKSSKILEDLFLNNKKYILATIHRAENTNNNSRLRKIIKIFSDISKEVSIVFPVHPRTHEKIVNLTHLINKNVLIIKPVSYFDMIMLEKNADLIITDSGGVQKEAYFLNKKCITLRKETEWMETLENNCNSLVDLNYIKIKKILTDTDKPTVFKKSIFGDGKASEKIVDILIKLA